MASVSPIPAHIYFSGADFIVSKSIKVFLGGEGKSKNSLKLPSLLYTTDKADVAEQVEAIVGIENISIPNLKAVIFAVSIAFPPPIPRTRSNFYSVYFSISHQHVHKNIPHDIFQSNIFFPQVREKVFPYTIKRIFSSYNRILLYGRISFFKYSHIFLSMK